MTSEDYLPPILIIILFSIYVLAKFGAFKNIDVWFLSREKKWALMNFFSKNFNYFNQLNNKERELFIIRAYRLAKHIKIIGRQDFEVTGEVKLLVVAAQIQLTFGFEKYFLNKFHTILIYPDAYQNKLTGNMHYGEVNPKGIIVISWKRFMKGYAIPDDKINLGLHEMAHALMHTIITSYDHEDGLDNYLREIVRLSRDEMDNIKNNQNSFFRTYAAANIYEFFAVCVEYFFEKPKELNVEFPQLYHYLVLLLKQDPINKIYRK